MFFDGFEAFHNSNKFFEIFKKFEFFLKLSDLSSGSMTARSVFYHPFVTEKCSKSAQNIFQTLFLVVLMHFATQIKFSKFPKFFDFSTQNLRKPSTHSHPGPQGFSPTRVQMAVGKSIADFFQKKVLLHMILTCQKHQKRE